MKLLSTDNDHKISSLIQPQEDIYLKWIDFDYLPLSSSTLEIELVDQLLMNDTYLKEYYKKLLKATETDINILISHFHYDFHSEEVSQFKRKRQLLKYLVAAIKNFSANNCDDNLRSFQNLKEKFEEFSEVNIFKTSFFSNIIWIKETTSINDDKHLTQRLSKGYLNRRFANKKSNRDIRHFYRTIIKLIFKNLDDESHHIKIYINSKLRVFVDFNYNFLNLYYGNTYINKSVRIA